MALEPGGYADKLGNRYEGRWVVRQLLRVLDERLRSVTCEAVGSDEHGVDLWVEHLDGIRQDQQCKIRNVNKNDWSIADLGRRGILSAMKQHLDRGTNNQFALVTPLPAILVHDICDSARNSSGDPEEFFAYQIKAIGEDRRKGFRQFCQRLGLNTENQSDRAKVFSYLQRLFIENWPDTSSSREDVIGRAEMLVRVNADGDASTVVAVLADFAQENLRKRLDAVTIWKYLKSKGFYPRRLSSDTRVLPGIQTLQRQFAESISNDLIAGKLIERAETKKILESVSDNAVVILHGIPGQGKSGVLYELTLECDKHNIVYLPLRLDRQVPEKTTQRYGIGVGLPESPVLCLAGIALDRSAVLILDQLDAIRWTSRHSLEALEVCKELLREIKSLRATGRKISFVLACRTYDLRNDPDIQAWLQSEKQRGGNVIEIPVEPLNADAVAGVITSLGQNPNQISERQRAILQSPQHLAMWVRITQDEGAFEFQSRVQLMRAYWNGRMREMTQRGVSESKANRVLTSLVDYLERHGRVSAPRSLVAEVTTLDSLCACGLLRANDGQITFSHQSYLDYQIASRVVHEINANNQDICDWLGPRKRQSLIRREQLRQALCLLSEESADCFLEAVKAILDSTNVRFHLKHLCLEVVGQLDNPSGTILAYLKGLVATDEWKEHIFGKVFLGQAPFVKLLIENGTLSQWLEDDQWRDAALWLLRNHAERMPDDVVNLLAPYAKRDSEWKRRVLGCLSLKSEDDSDSMFELRLELARQGEFREYVDWEKLPGHRALRLLEAVLSYWDPADLPKDYRGQARKRSRFEHWSDRDSTAMLRAVRDLPEQAWRMFVPQLCRLAPHGHEPESRLELWLDGDRHGIRQGIECIPHGLVQLVIESGRCLAKRDGLMFWKETELLRSHVSPVIQFLLVEIYSSLPSEVADEALEWLMEDSSRFALGTGYHEPEWKPAVRLIEALSPACSTPTFRKLEYAVVHYHSPDERRHAEWRLSTWKNGYFDDYWGRAQHFLLPALCAERQSQATVGLIGVLARKYAGYSEDSFVRYHGKGFSSVGSTLPTKALHRISDKAWLDIVRNPRVPHGRYKMRRWKEEHWEESSIRTFSRDLEQVTKRFPNRFGQLALRFPGDVHPFYKAAILDGLKQKEPKEVPEDEKAAWEPAPASLVEQVLTKFVGATDQTYAITFCRLLRDRAEEVWPNTVLQQLIDYACHHADPENGKLCIGNISGNFDSTQATVDNLENKAINCVRGVAALAIGEQLWNHANLLDQFRPTISHLCEDPHPAVRVAAIRACLPILNMDKDFAIECLCRASADELRVAASDGAVYFFNSGMQSHREQLIPIVKQMLAASEADVAEQGSGEVAARWLFHDYFEKELEDCLQGRVPHRKGLAHVAVYFVTKPEYFGKCSRLIERLKDDPDKGVRQSLLPMIRSTAILGSPEGVALVRSFIGSQAFRDDPTGLIYCLGDHSGNLLPFSDVLFSMCDQFVGPLRDASRDSSLGILHDVSQFIPILLRLHEQAEKVKNDETVNRCLDVWDAMFERRVGVVHELARAIG